MRPTRLNARWAAQRPTQTRIEPSLQAGVRRCEPGALHSGELQMRGLRHLRSKRSAARARSMSCWGLGEPVRSSHLDVSGSSSEARKRGARRPDSATRARVARGSRGALAPAPVEPGDVVASVAEPYVVEVVLLTPPGARVGRLPADARVARLGPLHRLTSYRSDGSTYRPLSVRALRVPPGRHLPSRRLRFDRRDDARSGLIAPPSTHQPPDAERIERATLSRTPTTPQSRARARRTRSRVLPAPRCADRGGPGAGE